MPERISLVCTFGCICLRSMKSHLRAATWIHKLTLQIYSGNSYSSTSTNFTSTLPSLANPVVNPTGPCFILDSGHKWTNHLVGTYDASKNSCYNFVYGGAPTNSSLVATYSSKKPDFREQNELFVRCALSKPAIASRTTADSTSGVWLGDNDIGNSYRIGTASESDLISEHS